MNNIKTFVLLKYEIITEDENTWHLCDTYPLEVKKKWAWRCADDVAHLAKGYKEAEECIRVAKLYSGGLATKEELDNAYNAAYHAAYHAAYYATRAAYAAHYAAHCAARAAYCAVVATGNTNPVLMKKYIDWLIEELCKHESKHE